MKTVKEILEHNNFVWDSREERWERKKGFGQKDTIEIMFKKLFIMYKGKEKVHDNFIESFDEFVEIINKNFKDV